MRFSQRMGITAVSKVIQRESMDDDLRNTLWSLVKIYFLDENQYLSHFTTFMKDTWFSYLKLPIDTLSDDPENFVEKIREYFFHVDWYEVYNLLEFVVSNGMKNEGDELIDACNQVLERENSAYRFVGQQIVEITSQEEINEIETAITNAEPYAGAKTHLATALKLMSDKIHPDYRNSIKESISAVESLAKVITGNDKTTLGDILKQFEKSKKIHSALSQGFSKLYGYTSDAQGIRHALLDEPNLTKADARFMLIACSAFINYVIDTVGT